MINKCFISDEDVVQKILGILWNLTTDTVKVDLLTKNFPTAKRVTLSQACTTFDALGILLPSLHKKWSFPSRISSVNVTKPANCGFGHIY